jgi:hypothetical protein
MEYHKHAFMTGLFLRNSMARDSVFDFPRSGALRPVLEMCFCESLGIFDRVKNEKMWNFAASPSKSTASLFGTLQQRSRDRPHPNA